MKKLILLIGFFVLFQLYALGQNYRGYIVEGFTRLEAKKAFVLGKDTLFNTTQINRLDTILVTLEYLKQQGGGLPPITGDDIGKSLIIGSDTTAQWSVQNDAIFKTGEHVKNLGIVKATTEERLQLNSTPMVNRVHTYTLAAGVVFPVVVHAETSAGAPNGYSGDFTITASNNSFANGVDATLSHAYKLYMTDANTLKMEWVAGQEIYDGYWGDKMWFRITEAGQAQQLTSKSYVDVEPKGVARMYTAPDSLIIKLRDSTLVKTYIQMGGGGSTDHATLANLGYSVSGHTGFAGTAVENTFTQNQKIEKAQADLIINSTSGNGRIEFQHNGNAGGQINSLSDGRLEIRSASDKYINLYNTFRWPVIPSPLVTPELKGMTYFNSNTNHFLGYDGTRWVNLGDTIPTDYYVPYVGATKDVDLNTKKLIIGGTYMYSPSTNSLMVTSRSSGITGVSNTGFGKSTLNQLTTGQTNTAVGTGSLGGITTQSGNTAVGVAAGFTLSSGDYNVIIGAQAATFFGSTSLTSLSNSTFLGYNTKSSANGVTNETVIGYQAIGAGSNTVRLGNTSVTKVSTSGVYQGANAVNNDEAVMLGQLKQAISDSLPDFSTFQLYSDTTTWDATKYNLSFYEPKLPTAPLVTPDRYFLNANKVWATVPTGAGAGYLGNLYFTPEASDVAGYFNLNSSPPAAETEKSALASNNEVLVASYIRQTAIGTSVIDGGQWGGVIRFKLSGNQGVSQMRIEIYVRSTNGTENVLFSQLTDELNSTTYVYIPAEFQKPSYTVDPNGRLGVKIYFKTTGTNITLTYMEGGSFASYITTPIRIRHSELRDWNIDPAYQHVTAGMKDSIKTTNQGGNTNYIWNQNTSAQNANMWISGRGRFGSAGFVSGDLNNVYFSRNWYYDGSSKSIDINAQILGLDVEGLKFFADEGLTPNTAYTVTERFRVSTTGNVGIGTTNPLTKLQVGDVSKGNGDITMFSNSAGTHQGASLTWNMTTAGGYANSILAKIQPDVYNSTRDYKNALDFYVGDWNNNADVGTAKMSIMVDGKVGLSTTVPTQTLDVNGNARFRTIGNDPMSSLLGVTSDGTLTTNIKIPSDKLSVTQAGHGLAAGDWIYLNGTSYEKAIATSNITADVIGVVVSVESADNFTFQYSGVLSGSFAAGQEYYLSTVTAGAIGAEPSYTPGQVRQFVGTGMIDGSLLIEIDIGLKISPQPTSGEVGGGTITSVSGTGSVNGISLSGTVTSSGSLTLGGALSGIENSQLTNSSITINGSAVSLGGSTTITPSSIGAVQADYPSSLPTNQTYVGTTITATAGEALAFGDFVYYKWSDKKVWKASASAYATARTRGIVVEAITADGTGKILIDGMIRNDTWTWTSAEVWLSTTAGVGTSTQPSTKGNQIQFLGTALTATQLLFKPSQDIGEK